MTKSKELPRLHKLKELPCKSLTPGIQKKSTTKNGSGPTVEDMVKDATVKFLRNQHLTDMQLREFERIKAQMCKRLTTSFEPHWKQSNDDTKDSLVEEAFNDVINDDGSFIFIEENKTKQFSNGPHSIEEWLKANENIITNTYKQAWFQVGRKSGEKDEIIASRYKEMYPTTEEAKEHHVGSVCDKIKQCFVGDEEQDYGEDEQDEREENFMKLPHDVRKKIVLCHIKTEARQDFSFHFPDY
jgi:hypothetical protein